MSPHPSTPLDGIDATGAASAGTWFYVFEAARTGPVTTRELLDACAAGDVGPETLVWTQGMSAWTRFVDVPSLYREAAAARLVPPPLPGSGDELKEGAPAQAAAPSAAPAAARVPGGPQNTSAAPARELRTPVAQPDGSSSATSLRAHDTAATPHAAPPSHTSGAQPAAPSKASVGAASGSAAAHELKPWHRWAARIIDLSVGAVILGVVAGLVAPDSTIFSNTGAMSVLSVIFMVPVDAFWYATVGRSPGKALFDISIRDSHGVSINGGQAARRTAAVVVGGFGLGVPLVNLFTMAHQHGRLKRGEPASYDASGGYEVVHGDITEGRRAGIVVAILAILALSYLGTISS